MLKVKPTANMSITPNHPNVDPNGNVRHEYLTDWKVALPINNILHVSAYNTAQMLSFLFFFSRAATSRLSCRFYNLRSLRRLLYTPIDNRLHLRLSHYTPRSRRRGFPHSTTCLCSRMPPCHTPLIRPFLSIPLCHHTLPGSLPSSRTPCSCLISRLRRPSWVVIRRRARLCEPTASVVCSSESTGLNPLNPFTPIVAIWQHSFE